MNINRFGMVRTEDAKQTGLEIFDFTVSDNPFSDAGDYDYADLCTIGQLKILGIQLTDAEKQDVRGFVKMSGYRGVAPVYSLQSLLNNRR